MRLIFTEPQPWENDNAVLQSLVFSNDEAQAQFMKKYADPNTPKTEAHFPDENGLGAIFKIRAVRNGMKTWDCVIRCGYTGMMLYDRQLNTENPNDVFPFAINRLSQMFSEACQQQVSKFQTA